MLPILVGTAIAFAVMALVIGTTVTVDNYLCKRKRIREINERHEERMSEISVRHAEFMLRMGMNPDYISRNLPMCTASRGNLTTFGRERWLELHSTELTDMPAPAVYTPEEAIAIELSAHWNERIKESLPDNAEVHSVEASIPGWDGTFIHLDENEDAMKRLSKRTDVPIPDWEDVPTKIPDDEPIPAPALFMLETVNKLKEICDDRETDDQSDR